MIIQFPHPSGQFQFSKGKTTGFKYNTGSKTDGIRFCNMDKKHYRKYICHKGVYLDKLTSKPRENKLYFWGEWELESKFTKLSPTSNLEPNAIHSPLLSCSNTNPAKLVHNTDPYVFGKAFYYTNCKQNSRSGKKLKSLKKDDLIIFGSLSGNSFLVDTVFIIDGKISATDYAKGVQNDYPKGLKIATLDLLDVSSVCGGNKDNIFYHSKMYTDDKDYFSFVPCHISLKNPQEGHIRLSLDVTTFGLAKNTQGITYKIFANVDAKTLWKKIVVEALAQGFYLGIALDDVI